MSETQLTVQYREIPGHPGYRVGDDGSVWSCRERVWSRGIEGCRGRIGTNWYQLKIYLRNNGYRYVSVGRGIWRYKVGRIVLLAFVGPCPPNHECCHNNGVRSDDRLENLRWDTKKANSADRVLHGTGSAGEQNGGCRLSASEVLEIRRLYSRGKMGYGTLAKKFGVTRCHVKRIVRGVSWRCVP